MNAQAVALLPQLIVAATVLVLLVADSFTGPSSKKRLAPLAALGTLAALAAVLVASPGPPAGQQTMFNGTIAVDGFSLFFDAVFLGLTLLVLMIAPAYLDRRGIQSGEFHVLLMATLMGMMVLVAAINLMTIFIAVELLSIALYILSAFLRTEKASQEAGLKYLLIGGFASGFLLYGMALLYGATGTTSVTAMTSILSHLSGDSLVLAVAGIGLVLVGMAYKASAAPFHTWTPDVYQGAPLPVVAFMSVGTKLAAVAVFLRVFVVGFGSAAVQGRWTLLLGSVAALSMIVGAVGAIRQDDLKRLLAYSSISQAGYLLLAAVCATQLGMVAGLFYLAAYAVMTFGAFAVVTQLATRGSDNSQIVALRGLAYRRPVTAAMMAVFMFSLAGFPPTVGFFGKLFVFEATISAGYGALAVVAIGASAVSIYYYLRVVGMMFTTPVADEPDLPEHDPVGSLAIALAGLATILLGLFPGFLYGLATRSSLL